MTTNYCFADFPIMKEVEDLLDHPTARNTVNGITRMCILAYFSCFKPESKSLRHLTKLQPVQDEDNFFTLLDHLPDWLSNNLKKLYNNAKASFLNV